MSQTLTHPEMHTHAHIHAYHHARESGATYTHTHAHPAASDSHRHKHDHGDRHATAHVHAHHAPHKAHDHANDILSFDLRAQKSPLAPVHAGVKLGMAIAALLLCVSFDQLAVSLFVGGSMLLLLRFACKLPLHEIMQMMRIPLAFLVLSCVAIAVQISTSFYDNALLQITIGNLHVWISQTSLTQAGLLFCKAYGSVCCLYFISVSTPMQSLIATLKAIHCPAIMVELTYLIYRYLFVLLDMLRKMMLAAHARLGYATWRASWYSFMHIGGNLLVHSFKRSAACFDAMEARCYDGTLAFYTPKTQAQPTHIALAIVYVCSVLAVGAATLIL